MSLKTYLNDVRDRIRKDLSPLKSSSQDVQFFELAVSEMPKVVEKKGQDIVFWGDDNDYPQQIKKLKYGSGIHSAILDIASEMIAGDGYLLNGAKTKEESEVIYNSLPQDLKSNYDFFIKNPNDELTNEEVNAKMAFDLKENGAMCCEVFLNVEKTKIVRKKYVDVSTVRPGKIENGKVLTYKISKDWTQYKKKDYEPTEVEAFSKDSKALNQLIFKKRGDLEYVGQPDWVGCITWVQVDYQMGIFHLSNLENGMNPSVKIHFFKKPGSETEKQEIMDDIRRNFVGAKKTGRHMVFFSDGKDLAPTVEPIAVSNLDKQMTVTAELSDKKILTGHKLTSPLLAGISVSGQIGGNTELETAYKIYSKTRIAPMSKFISNVDQMILDFNKIPITVKVNPYNPFQDNNINVAVNPITQAINSLSPLVANKVLESMSADEIRNLIGLKNKS